MSYNVPWLFMSLCASYFMTFMVRYHAMLGQPGSSPLDLFKFYIEELDMRSGHVTCM